MPRTRNELIEKLKDPGIKSNLFYICIFSAVCWVIWLVRNDFFLTINVFRALL